MHAHYGEVRNTEGANGGPLDAYVGDNADGPLVVLDGPPVRAYKTGRTVGSLSCARVPGVHMPLGGPIAVSASIACEHAGLYRH